MNNFFGYDRPFLTAEKFTAENALFVHGQGGSGYSGTHEPNVPWGQQCTRFLPDGTPVEPHRFIKAVLQSLTGDKDAVQAYIESWMEHLEKTCADAERRHRRRLISRPSRPTFAYRR